MSRARKAYPKVQNYQKKDVCPLIVECLGQKTGVITIKTTKIEAEPYRPEYPVKHIT